MTRRIRVQDADGKPLEVESLGVTSERGGEPETGEDLPKCKVCGRQFAEPREGEICCVCLKKQGASPLIQSEPVASAVPTVRKPRSSRMEALRARVQRAMAEVRKIRKTILKFDPSSMLEAGWVSSQLVVTLLQVEADLKPVEKFTNDVIANGDKLTSSKTRAVMASLEPGTPVKINDEFIEEIRQVYEFDDSWDGVAIVSRVGESLVTLSARDKVLGMFAPKCFEVVKEIP